MLSSEQNGPCDTAGVLALEEEGFGLAILETEDLAVSTDVELALFVTTVSLEFLVSFFLQHFSFPHLHGQRRQFNPLSSPPPHLLPTLTSRREGVYRDGGYVPFQGRSSRRKRYRRRYAYLLVDGSGVVAEMRLSSSFS